MRVRFNKNAESAIITLKYYQEKKDIEKNLSSGVNLIYWAETSFCEEHMEERGRVGSPLHNWHPDQGQPWQLNNTTFNLSELIMSYCYNSRRI